MDRWPNRWHSGSGHVTSADFSGYDAPLLRMYAVDDSNK